MSGTGGEPPRYVDAAPGLDPTTVRVLAPPDTTPLQRARLAREALDVLRPMRDKARRVRLPLMASFLDNAIRDVEQVVVAAAITDA